MNLSINSRTELRELIDLCAKKKVRKLELSGLSIELHDSAFKSEEPTDKIDTPHELDKMPTDEELLFHSTDLMPAPTPENN